MTIEEQLTCDCSAKINVLQEQFQTAIDDGLRTNDYGVSENIRGQIFEIIAEHVKHSKIRPK